MLACPVYQNYGKRIIAADYDKVGFTLALGLKDVNLMLQTAQASKTPEEGSGTVDTAAWKGVVIKFGEAGVNAVNSNVPTPDAPIVAEGSHSMKNSGPL